MTEYFDPEGVFQKVVIFNKEGKILFLQASDKYGQKVGTWDLSGGKVNVGESLEEAVKREVEEETGITLNEVYPVFVDIVKFVSSDGKTRIGIIYFANSDDKVKLSFEHSAYMRVPQKELKNVNHTFNMAPDWIQKALKIKLMMRL